MIRTIAVLCSLLLLASCVGPLPGAREPAEAPVALPARAGLQCPPDLVIGEATSLAFPGIGARGQRGPAIAHGDGVYLLVWQEGFSGQGGASEILGLRIDQLGRPLDPRPLVILRGQAAYEHPAVAYGGGRFLVVASQVATRSLAWSTLDAAGRRGSSGAFRPVGGAARPALDFNGQDEFLVVWQSFVDGHWTLAGARAPAAHLDRQGGWFAPGSALAFDSRGERPAVLWTGEHYLLAQRWNYAIVARDGRLRMPLTQAWNSKTAGQEVCAAAAWGRGHLFFNTEPWPDPWGWGGNGAIVGVSIAPDGKSPERDLARALGNLQAAKADGRVANCLDAARWRNQPGWPMGMRGGLKSTHNDQWPNGAPAAAFNGRSLLVVWPRARLVDNRRLGNRDLYLARLLPGWAARDRAPLRIVSGATEEANPALCAGPAGQALLAYERVTAAGVAVEYRLLSEAEDSTPPGFSHVMPQSATNWIAAFDEPLDPASVRAARWTLQTAAGMEVKIEAAAPNPDGRAGGREAILTLAAKDAVPGLRYTLGVVGLKDRSSAGNATTTAAYSFLAKPGTMQNGEFIGCWALAGPFLHDKKRHPFEPARLLPSPGDAIATPAGLPLAWREVNRQALDLGAIFDEQPERMCYAHTYVFSDRPRAAMLRLDSNDHNRCWVNGRLVLDGISGAAISRGFHDYADERAIQLRQGWNRLLIQVENRLTTWMLSAQITDTEGVALRDLTFQAAAPH